MKKKTIICLTGMHRSGTSLMSSYLEHCGIFMGERMAAPGPGNPRGHYEDRDFLDLNKAILFDNRSGPFAVPEKLCVHDGRKQVAKQLVASRESYYEAWGWKDPRSTLFLDMWHELVPEAKFVFMYRHPLLMLDSLFRRKGDYSLYVLFWRAGKAWIRYNEELLRFADKNPTSCILLNVADFCARPEYGRKVLSEFLNTPLEAPFSDVYLNGEIKAEHSAELHLLAVMNEFILGREMNNIYKRLEELTALSAEC